MLCGADTNTGSCGETLECPTKSLMLRAFSRPGAFLLLGTLAPHLIDFPLNIVWRSYSRLLRDNPDFFMWWDRLILSLTVLGVLSFVFALRVVLRPRKSEEARWDWNRVAATLALVAFAASAIHEPARTLYYLSSQIVAEGPRPTEPPMGSRLYQVHDRFKQFASEDPEKYYPALSRMDTRIQAVLAKKVLWFDQHLSEPGLPLRVAWEGRFYYYLGYRVRDDPDVSNFSDAYREALANPDKGEFLSLESAGLSRLGSYPIPSSVPGLPLPAEAWSGIPLLIEAIDPEKDTEGYVLFCDGHTERIPYPGHWPMTETTMTQLRALVDESLRADGEE
jgi:hypothetical protein